MKTEATYTRPDETEVSITFRCTVGELKRLKEQIQNPDGPLWTNWPLCTLLNQVSDL